MNRKLVKQVADLLCQDDATDASFFGALATELETRGWALQAYQGGIHGTKILVVKQNTEVK